MTEERRRHPRLSTGAEAGEDRPGEGGRAREPADTHFRRMNDRRTRPAPTPPIESDT